MAYIPIDLDGLAPRTDLTPAAKIVMGYLVYRIGTNSTGWPGMTTIARDLGIGLITAKRAVKSLTLSGLIVVENRGRGCGNRYRLSESGVKMSPHWYQNDTTLVSESGTKTIPQPVPKCAPNQTMKRTTNQTTPSPTPLGGSGDETQSVKSDLKQQKRGKRQPTANRQEAGEMKTVVDAVYLAYPRQVGRPRAVIAISKAIGRAAKERGQQPIDAARWLFKRTQQYADARKGQDTRYTPHPATWFNQERYADDPTTWTTGHGQGPSGTDPVQTAARHRPTAAERGDYPEPDRALPIIHPDTLRQADPF